MLMIFIFEDYLCIIILLGKEINIAVIYFFILIGLAIQPTAAPE